MTFPIQKIWESICDALLRMICQRGVSSGLVDELRRKKQAESIQVVKFELKVPLRGFRRAWSSQPLHWILEM